MASSSSSLMPSPTSTPAAPSATPTSNGGGGGGGGGGPTSSPLLFFVALGFGVVFTNLWIIVGVKYCFRYNQRNRRAQQDENGDPIDLVAMPHGPRRRRREKKLMSMDEVNERFPLMKYKAWMTTRAAEGLSTAGGVAAPSASRAASIRNSEGALPRISEDGKRPITPAAKESIDDHERKEQEQKQETASERKSTEQQRAEDPKPKEPEPTTEHAESKPTEPHSTDLKSTDASTLAPTRTNETSIAAAEDVEDDDQIQTAVPTEMMNTPGDQCAICIDTLEDDDDVRGLACGHAFHASCLDPWLTSRRACCPLCKADYYVPKPRPEGEAAAENERHSGRRAQGQRMDMPHQPQYAFLGHGPSRPSLRFPFVGGDRHANDRYGLPARRSRSRPDSNQNAGNPPQPQEQPTRRMPRWNITAPTMRMPNFLRRNRQQPNETPAEPGASQVGQTTPSQLEAGQR